MCDKISGKKLKQATLTAQLMKASRQVKLTKKVEDETLKSPFELNKLEVTIPANVTPDLLSVYLSTALDLEEEDFTLNVKNTTCLIAFSSTYMQTGKFLAILIARSILSLYISQSWKRCVTRSTRRS